MWGRLGGVARSGAPALSSALAPPLRTATVLQCGGWWCQHPRAPGAAAGAALLTTGRQLAAPPQAAAAVAAAAGARRLSSEGSAPSSGAPAVLGFVQYEAEGGSLLLPPGTDEPNHFGVLQRWVLLTAVLGVLASLGAAPWSLLPRCDMLQRATGDV